MAKTQPSAEPGSTGDAGGGDEFTAITSQADLDKVIGERIARERSKFSDYRDLKAKAERLDALEAATQTEADRTAERIAAAEAAAAKAAADTLRWRIAARHGITDDDAELFLTGTDEDTLVRQAERLAGRKAEADSRGNQVPLEGTGSPKPADDELRRFTRQLFRTKP